MTSPLRQDDKGDKVALGQSSADQEEVQSSQPQLRVVPDDGLGEIPEGVEPEPPLLYRLHAEIAEGLDKLPGVWSQPRPSFAERFQYSREGDWTADPESSWRRQAHVLAQLVLCLPMGLFGAFLVWASEKPGRAAVLLVVLTLADKVF